MQDKDQKPPKQRTARGDIEPGNPDYQQGETGIPKQEVYDEKTKPEKAKGPSPADLPEEDSKIVNEQEQNQVVNDDESAETRPKMNDRNSSKEAPSPQKG